MDDSLDDKIAEVHFMFCLDCGHIKKETLQISQWPVSFLWCICNLLLYCQSFYISEYITYSQRLAQLFIGTPSALRRLGEFTIITPQGAAGLTDHRVTLRGSERQLVESLGIACLRSFNKPHSPQLLIQTY